MKRVPDPDTAKVADQWMARLTSGVATPEDFAAARQWCEQREAHRVAFHDSRRFWQEFILPTQDERSRRRTPSGHLWLAAASVLMAIGLGLFSQARHWWADYRTAAGEQRTLTLDDGSTVILDSASALDVRFTKSTRSVHLLKGRASFRVAHNTDRPFVVHKGTLTATALGTTYSVRHADSESQVSVLEGTVAVATGDPERVVISAGERASSRDGTLSRSTIDAPGEFEWERGFLVARKMPLDRVLAELDRYKPGIILVTGAQIREIEVSGKFRLDHPEETLATLSSVFPIEVLTMTDYLVIVRDAEPSADVTPHRPRASRNLRRRFIEESQRLAAAVGNDDRMSFQPQQNRKALGGVAIVIGDQYAASEHETRLMRVAARSCYAVHHVDRGRHDVLVRLRFDALAGQILQPTTDLMHDKSEQRCPGVVSNVDDRCLRIMRALIETECDCLRRALPCGTAFSTSSRIGVRLRVIAKM